MSTLTVLDDKDLPWLTEIVDVVVACAGKPWRIALERLDDVRRFELPRAPARFAAAVSAVQRILGGRARNAKRAREARSLVLGAPALSDTQRDARLAHAASVLEVSQSTVEQLLWSDLPRERPVELIRGRPRELEVAAYANVQLLQRAVRRAHTVRLRVWGDAGPLVRGAAVRGLLMTVSHGRTAATREHSQPLANTSPAREPWPVADTSPSRELSTANDNALARDPRVGRQAGDGQTTAPLRRLDDDTNDDDHDDANAATGIGSTPTVIDIIGPLALFHRTAVYGKALADLMPLLADCAHFELAVTTRSPASEYTVEARSPVLLPPVPSRIAAPRFDVQRLVREVRRIARELEDTQLHVAVHGSTYAAHGPVHGSPYTAPVPLHASALRARTSARAPTLGAHAPPHRPVPDRHIPAHRPRLDTRTPEHGACLDARMSAHGPVLEAGTAIVYPDLVLQRRDQHTYVELVGFWTLDFLLRKLERYSAAGITDVLLCVDESRSCAKDELPADLPIVSYERRMSALARALYERTRMRC